MGVPKSCPASFTLAAPHRPAAPSFDCAFLRKRGCRAVSARSISDDLKSGASIRDANPSAGFRLEEVVDSDKLKVRLDSWIASHMAGISRSRVQSSIRSRHVRVNGKVVDKASHVLKCGDKVDCTVPELLPLKAVPEDIPLDIVYEDDHVLVLNKPVGMVVHPAPGSHSGTLVNGILHHCSLPMVSDGPAADSEDAEASETKARIASCVRPGVVHRLDKDTSGLIIVAKTERSLGRLSEQFKSHSIRRLYLSLTSGVPDPASGRINVPIGRDLSSRTRMLASSGHGSCAQLRDAASRYRVIETLAGGACALVQWRLETGRTHQIRAHARYLGNPLLGDELYGGTKGMALSLLRSKASFIDHARLAALASGLERHYLHAAYLKFEHPHTGGHVKLSCQPPEDFRALLIQLRALCEAFGGQ